MSASAFSQWPKRCAKWAGALVLFLGILVLLGWAFDISGLKSILPGLSSMVPSTALGFVLAGSSLWLSAQERGILTRRTAQAAALVVALLGALALAEYILGLHIGQFFLSSHAVAGRPAPLTAANFILLGFSLVLLDVRGLRRWLVDLFIVIPILISSLALVGYACNVPAFYGWRSLFPNTAMGLHTALAFALLGAGLLCSRPELGLMSVLTSSSAGGLVARRLLLAPVIVPLLTGLLRIACQKAGFYNAELAFWFFAFLNIFVFTGVIWWIASLLHRAEFVRQNVEQIVVDMNAQLERRVAERTSELKHAKELLQEREERLRLIIDTALDAVITIDAQGLVTGWSRQAETIFGWSSEEILGRRLSETILPIRYRAVHEQGLKRFAETHEGPVLNRRIELPALRRDGTEFPVELAITPVEIAGKFMFSAFVREITERKSAEEKAAWLASFPEQDPNPIIELELPAGTIHYLNPPAAQLFPNLQTRGLAHPWLAGLSEAARPLLDGAVESVRREVVVGESCYLQTINYLPDGQRLRVYSSDISERDRAEAALRQSEERFRTLAESMPQLIWTCKPDGWCDYLSRQWVDYTGQPAEEQLGSGWIDQMHPEDRDRVQAAWTDATAHGDLFDSEFRLRRADGVYRWFKTRAVPFRDDQGRVAKWFGSHTDFEDYKQAEYKLQTQLGRLDLLNRITRAISERQDLQSIFQAVTRNLEESFPLDFSAVCLFDHDAQAFTVTSVGLRSQAFASQLEVPEQTTILAGGNCLDRCLEGHLVYEADLSQESFPFAQRLARGGLLSLVLSPLLVESRLFGVLLAGRRVRHGFTSGDCEFLKQLSDHVALAAHQVQLHLALQQAYFELRRTQQAVMQQERLRVMGQMASGIAHDINNAISPVALYTESLLETEPNLSSRARQYLGTIQLAIEDVAATVARMREFYREREPQLTLAPFHLNRLVEQVLNLTRVRWTDMPQQKRVIITALTELDPDLPPVMGVESEIRDALTNLVFNSLDAMPEGGTLTLRTRLVGSAESLSARNVCVEVADTGIGMDEETRRRCFEPFFTTKGERGTGLGLAIVYGTAQRHNAEIAIESKLGQGTTVRLSFPSASGLVAPAAAPEISAPVPSPLRVLIVDDDLLLLKSLRDTLEIDGHLVLTAENGRAGIDSFLASLTTKEPVAVVITDLGMPEVDGRAVATAVKDASPLTPVILLTGWGHRLVAEGTVLPNVDRVLNKPPKIKELREALADCSQPRAQPGA